METPQRKEGVVSELGTQLVRKTRRWTKLSRKRSRETLMRAAEKARDFRKKYPLKTLHKAVSTLHILIEQEKSAPA